MVRPPPSAGKLKVMISSTALDLPAHRKAVEDAVLRAGCFPLAMEHASARSHSDAIRFSLEVVDQADVYVGVFAQRYGFVPDNPEQNPHGWSVTEHEYRRAVAQGLPRLIYLADNEHKFSADDFDFDPVKRGKLEALKRVLAKEVCGFFSSPEKLHSLVVQSLFEEKEKHGPAIVPEPQGPAPIPHPPEFYTVPPYTLTNTFVGRRVELVELDAWAASSDPLLVVEAIGGMGKSALTWEWAGRHAEGSIPALAGRVWWSFYERGTSMQTFLRHALAYVTRQDPETLRGLDSYECSQQLLAELRRQPFLLVLDGFERVLTAYHRIDKAQIRDDEVPADKRECTNPKDGDLLRQLVHCGPSKVLVSTRLMPKVLEGRDTHRPVPGVSHMELAGLAPPDALDLVRRAGVRGDANAVLRFAEQFDRHALVLQIVCGMTTDYRPKPGDFDAWRADPYAGGGLKLSELPLKQRYTHILEFAFRGLAERPRQLLSRIAALSDAADYATIVALNPFLPPRPEEVPEPVDRLESTERWDLELRLQMASSSEERTAIEAEHHKALADFHAALSDLEDRGLLQWDREANTYDLHPVVRAYAFEQLEDQDRTGTFEAIRDHFASLPPENVAEATELSQVKNSIEIVRALLGARRFEEAFDFYRGGFALSLLVSIGAYHLVVELLSPLVRCDQVSGPALSRPRDRTEATNDLTITLQRLGRSEEAIPLFREQFRLDLEAEDWTSLAIGLWNLANCLDDLNRLASEARIREVRSELAAAAGNDFGITMSFLRQLTDATIRGRFDEADSSFVSFHERRQPPLKYYRAGDAEYWLAVRRFFHGKLAETDLDHAEELATNGRNLRGQQRLAALRSEWELRRGNPASALAAIEQTLSIARRTGAPASGALGIRALVLARLSHAPEAREALAEADETSSVVAEAWLALGDLDRARACVQRAYQYAWADGPPHIHWYELKRCRELMAELGEPEPQLPPFDPAKVEPIPFEAEIHAVIERLKRERAEKEAGKTE